MGKGVAVSRSLQKKHGPDKKVWGKTVQTSLKGIANKAARDPKCVFRNLSGLLTRDHLRECFFSLKKKSAPGVDGVDYVSYKENLDANIGDLWNRVKLGTYKAKLVRRKHIPKGKGKTRPLGIPVIEDKLLQLAVKEILEAIYEEDFLPCSFGYRPKTGSKDAVLALTDQLHYGKVNYVVEADIRGFFDNIDHEWIIRMLKERIDDRPFLRLVQKWLKAGILEEDGKVTCPVTGTPQGGIVSPILANIYLHYALDLWFERAVKRRCKGQAFLIRYADDYVCAFQHKEDADWFYDQQVERLGKFGLEVAEEKTKVILFCRFRKEESGRFDFLGFEFYWDKGMKRKVGLRRRTSRKKLSASLGNFTEWIKKNRSVKLPILMGRLNAKLRGYWNYYGVIGNGESLNLFHSRAILILYKWLNRRSQRRSYDWEHFIAMLNRHCIEKPRITERVVRTASFNLFEVMNGSE